MSERPVEIPVERKVRDVVKKEKGVLTYSQFIMELMKKR
jgi:hypothetical protein